ncbi:MAG: hypothetical protein HFH95_11940 [Lachnospiraceae bacterium]|nr:hypothetical protein [uncultured Acetatifactor sp.]MCI8544001.1 hypothetical protein [Lachnospiraceae bacterium]
MRKRNILMVFPPGKLIASGNGILTIGKNNTEEFIPLNDFTCHETRLHNADWFNRMIALGSIQRYAV